MKNNPFLSIVIFNAFAIICLLGCNTPIRKEVTIKYNIKDSSFLPINTRKGGNWRVMTYYSIKDVPAELIAAINELNGTVVEIHEHLGVLPNPYSIKVKPEREFRMLTDEYGNWLMTYVHREENQKSHIHFIVFTMKNGDVQAVTAGIALVNIDSINTIKRLAYNNEVFFINLNDTTNRHKF